MKIEQEFGNGKDIPGTALFTRSQELGGMDAFLLFQVFLRC